MPKISPELLMVADHIAATTAAIQCLILLLQRDGMLQRGDYTEMLRQYVDLSTDRHSRTTLALLDTLRQSLLD